MVATTLHTSQGMRRGHVTGDASTRDTDGQAVQETHCTTPTQVQHTGQHAAWKLQQGHQQVSK
jgi:hypothetical protein